MMSPGDIQVDVGPTGGDDMSSFSLSACVKSVSIVAIISILSAL